MTENISFFQHDLIGVRMYSPVEDVADRTEVALQIDIHSFEQDPDPVTEGTLALTVEHSSDGVEWAVVETVDYDAAVSEVRSYSTGLLEKFRISLTPAPLPWETDGLRVVASVSALFRNEVEV